MTMLTTETISQATANDQISNINISTEKKVDTSAPENQQKIESSSVETNVEDGGDPNWRAFREARKRDRAEKEAAERRALEKEKEVAALKAAMEAAFAKSSPAPQAYQNYYGMNPGYEEQEESEEQRIERKVGEIIAKKEEQYRREQEEYEKREYPNRLSKDFPDFRQVCSQENLDYLDFHFPELSRPLQRLPEGYDKWSDIYHAVKKFIPNHAGAKKEALRADINAARPKSMATAELTPSGTVRETTSQIEQRRAENWARMQRVMKGAA